MSTSIHELVLQRRQSGILMPLFAMKRDGDWGVGDFTALREWTGFLASTGTKVLQILPISEMAPNQTCPYSALSAFAIDPVFIDVTSVEDVRNSPGAREFIQKIQPDIAAWHNASKANLHDAKQAKIKALWLGYQHFLENEQIWSTPRAQAFEAYRSANKNWLRNYSVFRALKEFYKWQSWTLWPEGLRNFDKTAVDEFELKYKEYVGFFSYVQWVADLQLRQAKAFAQSKDVLLFGDIPFSTNLDSAEVWSERENFCVDCEIGAPADQFSKGGQCWGLPAYNWTRLQQDNFGLWRRKIQRATELYDLFRLDHLVGFFRTYIFPQGCPDGRFDILDEQQQIDRGYAFLSMVLDAAHGRMPIGEDLGVIPNYVRRMLVDLKIPGYKVLRWEREDNGYYREPRSYPYVSLATTSTHDTETMRGWWETMPQYERANIWEMISAHKTDGNVPFTLDVQREILRRVLTSASALTMFSWQDIIGTLERVNVPGVVDDVNWTYRSAYTPAEASVRYAPELQSYQQLLQETGRV